MRFEKIQLFLGLSILLFFYACRNSKPTFDSNQKSINIDTLKDSSKLAFYKGDSIAYINFLFKNQNKYIGKPLAYLLKDLDIGIHSFAYSPSANNRFKVTNLILSTASYGSSPRIVNGEVQDITIGIGWQTYVLKDSINAIVKANGPPDYYQWSESAKAYFGKQIVGNLWLEYYMKK